MSALETERLAALIEQKHVCLTELRNLGKRQLQLVRDGEITSLLDVLVAKQRLIERLQAVERDLNPFRTQEPQSRRWRTELHRQKCAKKIQTCESLLREIIAQEKLGENELMRRRDATAVRLDAARQAGKARGEYVAAQRRDFGQLDLASEA